MGERPAKNRSMAVQTHNVTQEEALRAFLARALAGASGKRVEQLLKFKSVAVNGEIVTRGAHALQAGDVVTVHFDKQPAPRTVLEHSLRVVHEDADLIVVDKPPGLLSIATDHERERTAYAIVTDYVRERAQGARVFVVHRLDKGTSGLLLLARSEAVKRALQDGWRDVEKKYYAIVEGAPQPPHDVIRTHLAENKGLEVYSTDADHGAEAITAYRTVKRTRRYTLLEVTLQTGRKNQIRVHLAERGHPVAGDKKYGGHATPAGRLGLHACSLIFRHPVRGERICLVSPLPPPLNALLTQG